MKYLNPLIFLSLLSLPNQLTEASYPTTLEIEQAIVKLNPSLKPKRVKELSSSVLKSCSSHGVEWWVLLVVLKQESNFNSSAVNWESKDFGIGQFNWKTIKYRKLDLGTILTNEEYAIGHVASYLSEIKRKYAKIDDMRGQAWFTRYHSSTPTYRNIYEIQLKKHLKAINKNVRPNRKTHTRTGR